MPTCLEAPPLNFFQIQALSNSRTVIQFSIFSIKLKINKLLKLGGGLVPLNAPQCYFNVTDCDPGMHGSGF